MKNLMSLSYVKSNIEPILPGSTYYFGQLWDGQDGNAKEILDSHTIALEDHVIDFDVIEINNNDILATRLLVVDIL